MSESYYDRLAAAYVRGRLDFMSAVPLSDLTDEQIQQTLEMGREAGLRLHRFKRTAELPRVRKILGALRSIAPQELLDLGTGRGAFLWPLLDQFPDLPITCVDQLDYRVADIQAVARGGVHNLRALQAEIGELPFASHSFDVVTMLEVLEHIPDTQAALAQVSNIARRFLLLSVPSKEDNNPEHIHRFHAPQLADWLHALGWSRVKQDGVLNHIVMLASR